MGLLHRAYLLNAGGFKEKIAPILASLDAGDPQPLYEHATAIYQQIVPGEWILRLAGNSLLDIREVNSVGHPWKDPIVNRLKDASAIPSYEIGYWLLIIFSTFLERCPGMGGNYSILEWVLGDMLGWNQGDKLLLFEGTSTSLLLKPNLPPASEARRGDPYWHWMIARSSRGGWLSQDQVSYLYQRLLLEKETIQTFDYSRFGDHHGVFSIDVPDGQLDYLKRLQAAFGRAIMMLEAAQQAKMELYMTISYS
jgi:hypothetical protein